MIKNYFKIAWRNLIKNKAFSIINIAGLAIGVTRRKSTIGCVGILLHKDRAALNALNALLQARCGYVELDAGQIR